MIELLENLYRKHRQGLFTFALSIVRSSHLAEDAVQNAFANLIRQADESDRGGRDQIAAGYLYRSVRNASIDLVRADSRNRCLTESMFENLDSGGQRDEPSNNALTNERDEILRAAVDELGDADREAVVLKLFAGLTFEQAGEATGTSPKTIASRYRRAIAKLENQLKDQL